MTYGGLVKIIIRRCGSACCNQMRRTVHYFLRYVALVNHLNDLFIIIKVTLVIKVLVHRFGSIIALCRDPSTRHLDG